MQQSSSSIGSLAAALAKAQIELVNPEKSMVATIRAGGTGRGEQIFRYAPLSSGLDLVRKTLGKHEIAAVQATAIDHEAGIVRVTTRLCHSSGEWIASDWPVCSLDDMASRNAWAQLSLMLGVMPSLHQSELPVKMILTPLISTRQCPPNITQIR
jgi:hypothetical protein